MKQHRAARLHFAISELIDVLAEEIQERVATTLAARESPRMQPEPQRQQVPAAAKPPKLLRRVEVQARTGLCKTAIYERMKRGAFPAQVKLGTIVRARKRHRRVD